MRTARYKLIGQGIILYRLAKPEYLLLVVIDFVMARTFALPIPPVALYARDALCRKDTEKLCVLIGRGNVIVLAPQQFGKVFIGTSGFTLVNIFCHAQEHGPMLALCVLAVIKPVKEVMETVFLFQ